MALAKLKLLPVEQYVGVNRFDPIRFYTRPVVGTMYRRRVEMCLGECKGGERVLEVGFGSGVTFLNLHDQYKEIHGLDLTAKVDDVTKMFAARDIPTFLKNGNVLEMPYADNTFDTVLLISILEHLQKADQAKAFAEIKRVLKPGGQVVYGVPIERPFMVFAFRMLNYNIRDHHFSTELDVSTAAGKVLTQASLQQMKSVPPIFGNVYEVGHFVKPA